MTFGSKLQALRAGTGLSQEELAARLGVSRQAVSKWELDKAMPDAVYIVAVSDLFGVTTDYLLKDAPPEPDGVVSGTPAPETPPDRARIPGLLLPGANALFAAAIAVYLILYCTSGYARWMAVLLLLPLLGAPVVLTVSRVMPGSDPGPEALSRFRKQFALNAGLWGLAAALLCGFREVIRDLLYLDWLGLIFLLAVVCAALYGLGWGLALLVTRRR